LSSVGIGEEQLRNCIPLPMTFALCASLSVYARHHPLSFKASLFLFEEANAEFNKAFVKRCRELNMPKEFYLPIVQHAEINDDFQHDDISKLLLNEVPCVTKEEQTVVKRHVLILHESIQRMEDQILEWYGEICNNPLLRSIE
jgi:hypothetical protein